MQNCIGKLINLQDYTLFPFLVLGDPWDEFLAAQRNSTPSGKALPGCQGCCQPSLAMPCAPGKDKDSAWKETDVNFDLSPSKHACCSAHLLPLSSCSRSLSNYSAEWHDAGPQLASALRDGAGLLGTTSMSQLLGTSPGPFPPGPVMAPAGEDDLPERQAAVSIHLSSWPVLSSPQWLVWQGSTSWLICTSVGLRVGEGLSMAPGTSSPGSWARGGDVEP